MFVTILHSGLKVSVVYVIDHSQIVAMKSQQMRPLGERAQGPGIGQSIGVVSKNLLVNVNYVAIVGGHSLVITSAPFAQQTLQHGG